MAVLHIALRELRSALTTPVAWLVLCAWLLLTGVVWFVLVTNYVAESQNLVFNPYGASMLKVGDWLLMPFYQTSMVILMFLAPAIAMRLFSLEYSQRTFELLVTSPVRSWEIVLGKWLGAMGLCALMLLGTVHVPVWLYIYATPDLEPAEASIPAVDCSDHRPVLTELVLPEAWDRSG